MAEVGLASAPDPELAVGVSSGLGPWKQSIKHGLGKYQTTTPSKLSFVEWKPDNQLDLSKSANMLC